MNKILEFFKSNFLAFSILFSAILISSAILYSNYGKPSGTKKNILPQNVSESPASKLDEFDVGELPPLGDPNAPITIIEFGDYQCPFCKKFWHDAEPKIISEYVNTGKARLYWRDLAFLGEESIWAAEAAWCARDQGKFWEYHNILFENQRGENQGAFSKENLKKFASGIRLSQDVFSMCLDSEKYRRKVQEETQKSANLGVNSTPTILINGRKILGAQPYETFKAAIDSELSKAIK
ncbi:MAG: DsbA family protein [Candidatus Paceibacteria bacterium]